MGLTLVEATSVVEGAIAKAEELDIKINVAVCDAGGRLVAFSRMDGAIWAGGYGSQGEATLRRDSPSWWSIPGSYGLSRAGPSPLFERRVRCSIVVRSNWEAAASLMLTRGQ